MTDNIRLRFEWICPHCGRLNTGYACIRDSWGNIKMQTLYCDIEEGGCDQLVAVQPQVTVSTTTYKLIEAGYDPAPEKSRA